MSNKLDKVSKVWPLIDNVLALPHKEEEYQKLVALLDEVIDIVGEDESHPLASLMETLGTLVESYEMQNIPEISSNPIQTLHSLMEEHNVKQSDLPEIGTQGVVSDILSGKRKLNVRQIRALSKRFNVSTAVFI